MHLVHARLTIEIARRVPESNSMQLFNSLRGWQQFSAKGRSAPGDTTAVDAGSRADASMALKHMEF